MRYEPILSKEFEKYVLPEAIAQTFRHFVPCNKCPFEHRCEASGKNCEETFKNLIIGECISYHERMKDLERSEKKCL